MRKSEQKDRRRGVIGKGELLHNAQHAVVNVGDEGGKERKRGGGIERRKEGTLWEKGVGPTKGCWST